MSKKDLIKDKNNRGKGQDNCVGTVIKKGHQCKICSGWGHESGGVKGRLRYFWQ